MEMRQAPTIAPPSILVVAMGIAVVVPPKAVTNHPRAPRPAVVAEAMIRGQGHIPHLGTSPIDVLTLQCPHPGEGVTRGPGLDPRYPQRVVGVVMTSLHHPHHLGIAVEAIENAREKDHPSLLLAKLPVDVNTAIERWILTARTRLHPLLGMVMRTGETETKAEAITSNTTSGLLHLCASGRARRPRVLLG